eukprot:PLAT14776.1.p1 GENE.PLAT14776.1~~PLAT14776.1.p1  ORF type:complete len:179 (+),score=41.03 PLAT14776.1:254-790(+)
MPPSHLSTRVSALYCAQQPRCSRLPGVPSFRSMAPLYYRNAKAALLVFDVTNRSTFDAVKAWVTELRHHCDDDILIVIAGNKVDCEHSFDFSEATEYSKSIGANFYRTSAKASKGVAELFADLSRQLLSVHHAEQARKAEMRRYPGGGGGSGVGAGSRSPDSLARLSEPPPVKKEGCC